MVDELEYQRSLNRLRDALVHVDAGWRVCFYHQIHVKVASSNPYVPGFTGMIDGDVIKFSGMVCELPVKRQRTHYRRCQELIELISEELGYGWFYLTEVGHRCQIVWLMELPSSLLDADGSNLVTALRAGVERLAANTSRFYRLLESTEGYVTDIYDYDDKRPYGRA